ncbi:hypothetical protein TBLA_0A06830 [Henningerozyma blattae CBS 6284]|uniref:HIT-type domain-containing protein n=1 Tax=Henningerozyma blattae (strain ATCC 34711 / CBS 6284 / DSM 70876 / NBRC 10599 / NRRL Y-10934 / UCD 77-7) TaxID=1071380 RepID=I2GWH3_HENB6|nr:hypothetical protein TBLA_0A06830 [Tetrapisispora blattae CBS 6284]CCH58475.1 hypothetical protein TBLA_0A06830 [Tetrapisispora blattae CBS 6284]
MRGVEEINLKTYDPNVYFTSQLETTRRVSKQNSSNVSTSRSIKRVNYSLADLENKLYQTNETTQASTGDNTYNKNIITSDDPTTDSSLYMGRYNQNEVIISNYRCMQLDLENTNNQGDLPSLLSSITNTPRDQIESITNSISNNTNTLKRNNITIDIPKNIQLSYKSTKPIKPTHAKQKRNSNRHIALKKVLNAKRSLYSYVEGLDMINKKIIFMNTYNKRYFKLLYNLNICSICGNYKNISSCVSCGDKICSLNCFNTHNETRCSKR